MTATLEGKGVTCRFVPPFSRDQVELRPLALGSTKGGKEIWVSGELWCYAMPEWNGRHGLSHRLQYPGGSAIRAFSKVHRDGKLVDSDREHVVTIRSVKVRKRIGQQVEDQPAAIITTFLECVAAGNIKSPAQRAQESAESRATSEMQRLREKRAKDDALLGFISLRFRPDLRQVERDALGYIYREAFYNPMPLPSELLRIATDLARAEYNSFEPDNQSQRYKEITAIIAMHKDSRP